MPYYSVRITGGKKADRDAREVKEAFRGKASDYTGTINFFYVDSHREKDDLTGLINGMVSDTTTVVVSDLDDDEYHWEKSQ